MIDNLAYEWKDILRDGRSDGRTVGRTDGQTDRQTDGRSFVGRLLSAFTPEGKYFLFSRSILRKPGIAGNGSDKNIP